MNPDETQIANVVRLCEQLDAQARRVAQLERYYDGDHPIPKAIEQNRVTDSYKHLLASAQSNWPQLIVDSVEERLEVQGVTFGDEDTSAQAWAAWQRNNLDADAGTAHQAALISGRSYAIVWGTPATITLDHGSCVYVEYADGTQRDVVRAIRRWNDGTRWNVTLYEQDAIYKFQSADPKSNASTSTTKWERRYVADEDWPLPNDTGRVPVFEIAVNRALRTKSADRVRGEFEAAVPMVDRINYTMFSLLAAMTWSGFPLRALTGEPIEYRAKTDSSGATVLDDNGKPVMESVAPFNVAQDQIVQLENPDARLTSLPEATLTNYINTIEMQVKHLAAVTKTPAHYLLGEMVNLSADAIRAAEAGLISKVRRHQRELAEAWEDILRYALTLEGAEGANDIEAQIKWADPESRSLAERADAAVKLANILPWQALAETTLGSSPREIATWEAQRASENLGAMLVAE